MELLLTGKVIDAQEAFRIGLVNQVINHEHLTEEAKRLAESIAEKTPLTLKCILQAVNRGLEASSEIGYEIESDCLVFVFRVKMPEEG